MTVPGFVRIFYFFSQLLICFSVENSSHMCGESPQQCYCAFVLVWVCVNFSAQFDFWAWQTRGAHCLSSHKNVVPANSLRLSELTEASKGWFQQSPWSCWASDPSSTLCSHPGSLSHVFLWWCINIQCLLPIGVFLQCETLHLMDVFSLSSNYFMYSFIPSGPLTHIRGMLLLHSSAKPQSSLALSAAQALPPALSCNHGSAAAVTALSDNCLCW